MHACYGTKVVRGLSQGNQEIMKDITVLPRCNSLFF